MEVFSLSSGFTLSQPKIILKNSQLSPALILYQISVPSFWPQTHKTVIWPQGLCTSCSLYSNAFLQALCIVGVSLSAGITLNVSAQRDGLWTISLKRAHPRQFDFLYNVCFNVLISLFISHSPPSDYRLFQSRNFYPSCCMLSARHSAGHMEGAQ